MSCLRYACAVLASRLLSILLLLQTRGRMSAADLAAQLEVTVRTIHRDIDQLSAAGIPVYAERGRHGGFRLRDGYRTTLTGLTAPEAETLFLSGLPGPAAQLGLADILSAARLKLLAALPESLRSGAERVASRFHLDPATWFQGADRLPALPIVAQAVWEARMLVLRYRRDGAARARMHRLGPLGLVLKAGTWYLVAQSGDAVLTWRIANIEAAEPCAEAYARPRGFDLAAHWERASHDYEEGVYHDHADVRLSPRGLYLLRLLGPHVMRAAAQGAGKPDRNGWVRCRLPIESVGHAVRELMQLGDEVTVIGPAALRARLARTALAMARRHRMPPRRSMAPAQAPPTDA
jgi:predicted DNA-binding transcriptional regulator YafY